jgi:N-acetylmuramoyl-L-alanine amidase
LTSLAPGAEGQSVHELQGRLRRLGFAIDDVYSGRYEDCTVAAVSAFQQWRALPDTGWCDSDTWTDLIEAGYSVGDRPLCLSSPMLRGDDVLSIQQSLSALGFDVGWIDGIYGRRTAQAVGEFQKNVGFEPTGTCDEATFRHLALLGNRNEHNYPVAAIRERERLEAQPRELAGRRLLIGHDGSLGSLCHALSRKLRRSGALVQTVDQVDGSQQARFANAFAADAVLSWTVSNTGVSVGYYETDGFRSRGGEHLATLLSERLAQRLGGSSTVGRRFPVLRETRMPAVLIELPLDDVDVNGLVEPIIEAITAWVVAPLGHTDSPV